MKKLNNKGFIAISVIYSFFILFVTIMLLIIYSYVSDRKLTNSLKKDIIDNVKVNRTGGGTIPEGMICAKARTLHTETCGYSVYQTCDEFGNDAPQCGDHGQFEYYAAETCYGVSQSNIITYGNLDEITSEFNMEYNRYDITIPFGEAFDCDVNGDGLYDANTERFYYLSDTNEGQSAILIYYNNVSDGFANSSSGYVYGDIFSQIPTSAQWPDIEVRSVQSSDLSSDYGFDTSDKSSNTFLGENTEFISPSYLSDYWVDAYVDDEDYRITGQMINELRGRIHGNGYYNSELKGSRPVIIVPKDKIQID